MTIRDDLAEVLGPDAILWADCDAAIVGWVARCGGPNVVCYDYPALVACFVRHGMTEDEADEWVSNNIAGAYVGPNTPMILYRFDSEDR